MEVLIVENEKPAADKIARMLKKTDNSIHVAGVIETVEGTINWLQHQPQPDLIIMDIQLDDGLCFEVFETIHIKIPVIFTTAYDEYTLKAFKVNSIDYLIKPVEEIPLRDAISKFKSLYYADPVNSDKFIHLLKELDTGYKNRFLVKIGIKYRSVPVREISCFYILERATFLRTFEGKDYAVEYSLEYIENKMDPGLFFRISRTCIVNINAVNDIVVYSSNRLKIMMISSRPSDDFVVSRDKIGDFKRWMDR